VRIRNQLLVLIVVAAIWLFLAIVNIGRHRTAIGILYGCIGIIILLIVARIWRRWVVRRDG
jgi:hypothetical protein